jgi:hypothetical protein
LPQRGVPAAAAGTRFIWPQCPQRISSLAMASLSRAGASGGFWQLLDSAPPRKPGMPLRGRRHPAARVLHRSARAVRTVMTN